MQIRISYFGPRVIRGLQGGAARNAVARGTKRGVKAISKRWKTHSRGFTGGLDIEETIGVDEGASGSNDERLVFTNYGTKAHEISGNPTLAFNSVYKAGTKPGAISARPASSGGAEVYAATVQHPGLTARDTDKAIAVDVQPEVTSIYQQELASALG